ncbi:hypothetical protein [Burkholderia cenocepacia]|uniref:hypothetical protein n=1 Tax=Burkholderia cenocepacia TaxID=95486 RepID=UPI000F5AB173|nr:hypothetical protein [Burkholderia cenocepacia]RQU83911.1 hypothetical protein DF040_33855 [Burkholderia cenocepacia]
MAAQTLEEIDGAIAKVEDLTLRVDQLAATIGAQSDALAASAQNVREAVTAFSAQAKTELKDFLQAAASKSADEQRAALQEVARTVLREEMTALQQEMGDTRPVGRHARVELGWLTIGLIYIAAVAIGVVVPVVLNKLFS